MININGRILFAGHSRVDHLQKPSQLKPEGVFKQKTADPVSLFGKGGANKGNKLVQIFGKGAVIEGVHGPAIGSQAREQAQDPLGMPPVKLKDDLNPQAVADQDGAGTV